MSQRPSATAVIPEPEPVGLYVKVIPSLSAMNCSPSAPMTFSIEVDPSVDTEPAVFEEPQPVTTIAAISVLINKPAIFFFIVISPPVAYATININ